MSVRIYFLIIPILVLSLVGIGRAESIEVTNGSFELDVNGVQIDWKEATMEHVLAWENTPGLFGYAGVNGSLAKHPGSDGRTYAWGHNYDGGSGFYQVLDHAIVPGKHYTVIYDAKNLWQAEPNHFVSFFYVDGQDHVELQSQYNLITTPNTDVWDNLDLEMLWTSLPEEPYIGKLLGIKFYFPDLGNTIYTGIDNVRLESKDACYAWKAQPEDGVREVAKSVTLSWAPGLWAESHEVYLGTSFAEVNDANSSTPVVYRGSGDVTGPDVEGRYSYTPDEVPLVVGRTYYWRVDEVNETYGGPEPPAPPNGRWKGEVWRFRVTGYALNPYPADGATGVPMTAVLNWTVGTDANGHDVYFGTSFEDVNSAELGSPEYVTTQAVDVNSYDVSSKHMLSETFYWRIDEVNEFTLKGDVWRFTVEDFIVAEDFDSYTNPNILRGVWNDGFGNDTGSEVGVETETVRDGNSLKFSYNNYWFDYYYSEIEADVADLGVGPNWKYGGAESLVLWFYGDPGNDANEQMYVVLEDSGTDAAEVHYYGDMNDIKIEEWQEWNIGLDEFTDANSLLNLSNTAKIYIGFGIRGNDETSGGEGVVWFEDIRLYPRRCVPKMAYKTGSFGDLDADCVTDYYDLDVMGRDWLMEGYPVVPEAITEGPARWYMLDGDVQNDGSDLDADGTIPASPNDPEFVTKQITPDGVTTTLYFDGGEGGETGGDYVFIPAFGFDTDRLTITAWIKGDASESVDILQTGGAGIVWMRDSNSWNGHGLSFNFNESDWSGNGELNYCWDELYWDWHSELFVPEGEWTFVGVVVEPEQVTLYMKPASEELSYATQAAPHHPVADTGNWVGKLGDDLNGGDGDDVNEMTGNCYWGWMSDVRIYNYSLSEGEILDLCGGSAYFRSLDKWRADADRSGKVDLADFAIMADYWLEEILFPMP